MEQSYKEKYEQALAKAKEQYNYPCMRSCMGILEEIFPELAESEDEKIVKELLTFFRESIHGGHILTNKEYDSWIAWLEKQESEPNRCHHKVDLSNCSEEYRKAYYDGWNNCNMQYSQCKSESNDVVKCLINGMRFYYEDNEEATWGTEKFSMKVKDILTWLERQGDYANFRDKAQVGDRITKNENGVLVNLSQLKRVAKPSEKQGAQKFEMKTAEKSLGIDSDTYNKIVDECIFGEQKPTDKDEPKFKVGDWLIFDENHNSVYQVERIDNYRYYLRHYLGGTLSVHFDNELIRLWTLQDAKPGDMLACNEEILLFKSYSVQGRISLYCWYNGQTNNFHDKEVDNTLATTRNKIYPATKEQRDLLFSKMNEAGYEWDADTKELKKVEEEEYNGEDYGIDSLYHAQRILEKTLGKVDGYQSDDGILEHKCAITAVKKLYEQNPAWSEEDSFRTETLISVIKSGGSIRPELRNEFVNWLKSLKGRVGCEANCTTTKEWNEEDEHRIKDTVYFLDTAKIHYASTEELDACIDWLKSIKGRVQPKQEWSEEDKYMYDILCGTIENTDINENTKYKLISWLKSLRPQNKWKPSDEQMECLSDAIEHYNSLGYPASKLKELLDDLKKLKDGEV